MKKIFAYLILISLFFNLNLFSYATNKIQMAEISKIENNLFGFDYNNQDLKERVIRLENTVYGKSGSGDLNNRLKKLANDILAEQIGSEIPPNEDTFNNEDIADSSVNYPIIDEIETKIFGRIYDNNEVIVSKKSLMFSTWSSTTTM